MMVAEHSSPLNHIQSLSPSMAIVSTNVAASPSTTPTSPFFRTNCHSNQNRMDDQYQYSQQQQQQQQGWFLRHRQQQEQLMELSSSKRSHEEDVYEDLCYVTLRSNNNNNNSNNRDSNNTAIHNLNYQSSNSSIQSKRDYCLKELIETEKNYCEALQMIIDHFCQPLIRIVPVKHRNVIFSNLQSLSELHWKLYQDLYRTNHNGGQYPRSINNNSNNNIPAYPSNCSSPSVSTCSTSSSLSSSSAHPIQMHRTGTISSCFLSIRDRFLNYGQYCSNLPKAQQLLDELCGQDPVIEHWVGQCQQEANQGRFKLRDLLSLPMQRILKYHLLLGELIRNTSDQHEDFEGLRHAYDMMLDIGAYINEMKRDTETLEIINDVQRSIIDLSMPDDYQLKDYGRLIKDGEVRMRGPSTQDNDNGINVVHGNCNYNNRMTTRLKNRYIFVFDKVMLMCKTIRSLQYSYKEAIVLEEYKLEDMSTCSPISKLTKNWSSGWSLVHCRTKQPYTFFVKNEEIKRKWIEAIERAQDNVRPKQLNQTDHHLALATVAPATCCASCHKLLKGTWFQAYQCYVCNIALHKTCITTVRSCAQMMHQRQSSIDANQSSPSNDNKHDHHHHSVNSNRAEPPTPSKNKQRILAKAISAHYVDGQLPMEPNDTIVVYSTNGPFSYGLNLRLSEEGSFPNACITELMADSPSNASSSNIDSPTCSSVFRFCYDDQTVQQQQHHHQSNDSTTSMTQTLPRKLHQSNWIMPTSPLAVSTPALNKEDIFFANDNKSIMKTNQSSSSMNPAMIQDGNLRLFFGNGYNLEEYAWFAGSMDRDTAQTTLNPLPNGSFLVRISPKQKNSYAISINYKGLVNHMRVQVTYMNGIQPTILDSNAQTNQQQPQQHNLQPPDKPTHFYLSERRYFRTIVDLIRWYELNSLAESFNMVNTKLLLPYKKAYCNEILGDAIALYAFTGTSSAASSFLSLRKGDHITVLSRAAEDKGWWKGQIDDRLGYFPFKYVEPTSYSLKRLFDIQHETNQQYQQPSLQQDDSFGAMTTSTQMTDVSSPQSSPANKVDENKQQMPSPSSSSTTSSAETSSPTTLSSPVNSDRDSPQSSSSSSNILHSRQASSDAGIGDDLGQLTINNQNDSNDDNKHNADNL
ncbi:protein vav-like isoform X2 [Dermatophagoides pteronyssinus]